MILGLGTDIVEVARIRASLEKYGAQFTDKFLLPAEVTYCRAHRDPAPQIAARFAAKEAIAKAFGTGFGAQLGWLDLEIAKRDNGEPFVILHDQAKKLLSSRGAQEVFVTLSHTENYATATAILQ
jgi:holo-[acyl-carrier protein] synthase